MSRLVLLLVACVLTSSALADSSEKIDVSCSLRDGSVVKGILLTDEIAGAALFDDELELPAKIVKSVELASTNRDAKVTLVNGDQLKLKVKTDSFKLDSSLGELKVETVNIRSMDLRVNALAGDTQCAIKMPVVFRTRHCPSFCYKVLTPAGQREYRESGCRNMVERNEDLSYAPPMEFVVCLDDGFLTAAWVHNGCGSEQMNTVKARFRELDGKLVADGEIGNGCAVRFEIASNGTSVTMIIRSLSADSQRTTRFEWIAAE